MFTKSNLPPYERLAKLMGFRFKVTGDPETSDPDKLNELINNALQSNDLERLIASLEHAKRLVLYTGVPGIIQYVNVTCQLLDDKDDSFRQQAFNALVHLNMAEKLLATDKQAKQLIIDILKDDSILLESYWDRRKNDVIERGHLELRSQEARDAADSILQRLNPALKKLDPK